MDEQFWLNNPYDLFKKEFIMRVIPNSRGSLDAKLNAVTRAITILTVLGYALTGSWKILVSYVVTIIVLVIVYKTQNKESAGKKLAQALREGFTSDEVYETTKHNYEQPKPSNPFMNVTLDQITYEPERKAAAPAYNKVVEAEINESVKENLDKKLFRNIGDDIDFEASMRNFHTNPSTTIPNNQKEFAEFCYGKMSSCKEGNDFACMKRNFRHILDN
jgi:hypothetical protein